MLRAGLLHDIQILLHQRRSGGLRVVDLDAAVYVIQFRVGGEARKGGGGHHILHTHDLAAQLVRGLQVEDRVGEHLVVGQVAVVPHSLVVVCTVANGADAVLPAAGLHQAEELIADVGVGGDHLCADDLIAGRAGLRRLTDALLKIVLEPGVLRAVAEQGDAQFHIAHFVSLLIPQPSGLLSRRCPAA